MKRIRKSVYYISILFVIACCFSVNAQKKADRLIEDKKVEVLVDSISKLLEHYYISETMGGRMGNFIKEKQKAGEYNKLTLIEFGKQLTKDLRAVSNDVHMSAFYREQKDTPKENRLSNKSDISGGQTNYGYEEIKILEGNIGYLKVAHFTKWRFFEEAKVAVSNAIGFLQNTDALIIDVRNNPGGFEDIVAYLCSYFFDTASFDLQEYYCRYQNSRRSIHTSQEIPGQKLAGIPIYILVNKDTGSAAESFAYLLKHLDRATIIGETTVGAGNGSVYYHVSDEFWVQIAVCETINGITKTSWEKVGVVPNIKTTSEGALDKALELAKFSGKEYRTQLNEKYRILLNEMDKVLKNHSSNSLEDLVIQSIKACYNAELLKENEINALGYEYLGKLESQKTAELIFKTNSILNPKSANVFDSYAEALLKNGKRGNALINFQKAVELAKENGDPNLNVFIENLENAKNAPSTKD